MGDILGGKIHTIFFFLKSPRKPTYPNFQHGVNQFFIPSNQAQDGRTDDRTQYDGDKPQP